MDLYTNLSALLLENPKFFKDGLLLKSNIIEASLNLEKDLIEILLKDEKLKNAFFEKVENCLVFDKVKFQNFIANKKFLPDSFTSFKNKIGLSKDDNFLVTDQNVVLSFPYKDCVLEGGQTKEDRKKDRKEIFWNTTLSSSEIDNLFEPKSFSNLKRFDSKKEAAAKNISLNDNLVIKGNNLIALHSLKEVYKSKVKMVYIDPPYNSGSTEDTFSYNNTFTHSSWLTFMKNRLEVSRELLTEDGFIAIAIDSNELGYLIVLTDEIFGRENMIDIVTVVHNAQGRNQAKFFATSTEFMLVYAKNKLQANFNQVTLNEEKAKEFNQQDDQGKYKVVSYIRIEDGPEKTKSRIKKGLAYPIYVSKDLSDASLKPKKNYVPVYPHKNKVEKTWKKKPETFLQDFENGLIVFKKDSEKEITVHEKQYEYEIIKTHWIDKKYSARFQGTVRTNKMIGSNSVSYPKSLYTVKDTLKLMTKENDIVLDFFAGSGTTGEAVLALNKEDNGSRRFILVEQLDEHLKECTKKLHYSLKNEHINSSFIYFELSRWNEIAVKDILECKDTKTLIKKFKEFSKKYQLTYRVNIENFINTDLKDDSFLSLDLNQKKEILLELLDFNQLYINFSDSEDSFFQLSSVEKKLTQSFYND